jgi:hypothetical protein
MISKSPARNTFQTEGYIKRCEEKGKAPNPAYINMYKTWEQQKIELEETDEWKVDNMEYDLRSNQWILDKVKSDNIYAQHLYAAMCNNNFTKNEVWPILTEKKWSASWRHAGGIIADMREQGDYIDWYCSGIRNNDELAPEEFNNLTTEQQNFYKEAEAFVPESVVTDEIREDLLKLGWIVVDNEDEAY